MIRLLTLFSVYWLVEAVCAIILYYCACALGMWALDWPDRLFWMAGIPILIGILVGGAALFLIVHAAITVVKWNWKSAKQDIVRSQGKYYE